MYQRRENIYLALSKLFPRCRYDCKQEEMLRKKKEMVEAVCNYIPQSQKGYETGSPPFRSKENCHKEPQIIY